MAKATVKAPVGYHFMVHPNSNFYLMETSAAGYEPHTDGDFKSQLSVEMEVKESHTTITPAAPTSATSRSSSSTASSSTTSTSRTSTRSTGGGYSGGY